MTAYAALTQAMMEYGKDSSGFAMIVRKVYRAGAAPRLGVMMPEKRTNEEDGEDRIVSCDTFER